MSLTGLFVLGSSARLVARHCEGRHQGGEEWRYTAHRPGGGGGRRKRTPSLGVIGMYVVNGHAHRVNVGVQDWSEEAELGRRVRVLHGELHLCLKGGGGGGKGRRWLLYIVTRKCVSKYAIPHTDTTVL